MTRKLTELIRKLKKASCEQHFQWYNTKGEIESFCCETFKDEAQYMNAGPVHIGKCLKCTDIERITKPPKDQK